jgi:hypothetical protein
MDSVGFPRAPCPSTRLHPTTLDEDGAVRIVFERARDGIVQFLSSHKGLYAVGLIRRGRADHAPNNPLVILITGEIDEHSFPEVVETVRSILAGVDQEVSETIPIELLRAKVTPTATSPSHPVRMGAPISVAHLTWDWASIGGYIRLKMNGAAVPENDSRRCYASAVYGLTCHHVLRPTRSSEIDMANTGKLSPG